MKKFGVICILFILITQYYCYSQFAFDTIIVVKERWPSEKPKVIQLFLDNTLIMEKGYHENGQLGYIGAYKEKFKVGKWIWYNPTGKYKRIINVHKDTLNGEYKEYYDNGLPKLEGVFLQDKEEGKWKYWYENGNKQVIASFKNGLQSGEYEEYYPNGVIKIKGFYENGQKIKKWSNYDINGNIINTTNYDK